MIDMSQQLQGVCAQLKGINTHLGDIDARIGDIDSWKKGVDTQLGHLASQIPRPQGQLPGRPEENPRGQIAVIHLRSGNELPDRTEAPLMEKEQTQTLITTPGTSIPSRYGVGKTHLRADTEPNTEQDDDTDLPVIHTGSV